MFTNMSEKAKYLEQLFAFSAGEIREVYAYWEKVHAPVPLPPGAWYHPQYPKRGVGNTFLHYGDNENEVTVMMHR